MTCKICKTCMCKKPLLTNCLQDRLAQLKQKMDEPNDTASNKETAATADKKDDDDKNNATAIVNEKLTNRKWKSSNKFMKRKMDEMVPAMPTMMNDDHNLISMTTMTNETLDVQHGQLKKQLERMNSDKWLATKPTTSDCDVKKRMKNTQQMKTKGNEENNNKTDRKKQKMMLFDATASGNNSHAKTTTTMKNNNDKPSKKRKRSGENNKTMRANNIAHNAHTKTNLHDLDSNNRTTSGINVTQDMLDKTICGKMMSDVAADLWLQILHKNN